MKPKQKSVTMWAIVSPFTNMPLPFTVGSRRKDAWYNFISECLTPEESKKDYQYRCYRAVKGKFVWEEK